MFNTLRAIFLTTAFALLLGVAAAQDAGQYVILNAQFGTESNHVDVTNRLQELARADRPFQVNHDSMAADPDHGRVKVLRVFARGPNGQERMFEFPEGSVFDGAQFRSWTRADWGDHNWTGGWNGRTDNSAGQYMILSAQYGNEMRHLDVTNQLKQMVQRDRFFRLNYQTFGVDPAGGQAKVLRVFARTQNGMEQMFEYRDNSLVDGALFQGWNDGQWGTGNWSGNWNGGGYVGSNNAGGDAGQYLILNAQFGTASNHVDVTNRLRELARTDRPFRVNQDSMAADPDHGRVKVLRVFARGPNGQERMFEFPEGSVFDSAQFHSWGRGDWGDERWQGGWEGRANNDAGDFVILSAQYGTESRHVDVTSRLKEFARQDRVFRLDNRMLGVDPAEGQVKVLRIFARGSNGQERMFEYQEHSLIDGAMFRGWGTGEWGAGWSGNWNTTDRDAGQFVILSAQYGTERRHVDVTNRLRELARADVRFRMGNSTFGVDPDRGVVKVLRIYARGPNGRERMFEYREGSVVDGAQFRGWGRGEWGGVKDRWSGRWEGEEREERQRERDRDRQ